MDDIVANSLTGQPFFRRFLFYFGSRVVLGANQTLGGLGHVCASGMYSSTKGNVEFPKFQTGIFGEWKAPTIHGSME